MNYYLYGENLFAGWAKLRQILDQFLRQSPPVRVVSLNKKNSSFEDLKMAIRNNPLFGEENGYLVEEWGKFSPKEKKDLLVLLGNQVRPVIFWDPRPRGEEKELREHFPDLRVFSFPQPKGMFHFLEAIFPGNEKVFMPLFTQLIKKEPLELVFYFLKKHCHDLLSHEETNLPSWRKEKLARQKKNFSQEKLISFYLRLVELEYKDKTGELGIEIKFPLANLLADV